MQKERKGGKTTPVPVVVELANKGDASAVSRSLEALADDFRQTRNDPDTALLVKNLSAKLHVSLPGNTLYFTTSRQTYERPFGTTLRKETRERTHYGKKPFQYTIWYENAPAAIPSSLRDKVLSVRINSREPPYLA